MRSRELLAIGVFVLSLLRPLRSLADSGAYAERAILQLEVNGTTVDDVVVLTVPGDVFVPWEALNRGGVVRLTSPLVRIGATDYVALSSTRPRLKYSIDQNNLTLDIVAPPEALAETTLDVSDRAPTGAWYSEETSAYLTYAPSLIDLNQFRAFAETGLNSGGMRAMTNASYDQTNGIVRLLSQWTMSDRENVRELVIGDSYVTTGALGGGAIVGGLTLQRNFALDPYLVKVPRLGYQGSVIAPSTVDVYVNDVLVRRVAVAPGQFDLQGVAPLSGAGNVRYVISDPLSRQSDVAFEYYATSGVLRPGLSEYAWSAGFVRQKYGRESFDYGAPLLLGRYRVGLTNALTAGARAELLRHRASFGSELTVAGKVGELNFASAASIDVDRYPKRGSAGQIGYYYQARRVSLRAVAKFTSRDYCTSNLAPSDDRELSEYSASSGLAVGTHVSLSAQIGFGVSRDLGPRARMSIAQNYQFTNQVSVQLLGSRTDNRLGETLYDAFATLTVNFAGNHMASVSGHTGTTSGDATASVIKPIIGATGVGYQASATVGPTRRYVAAVQAQNSLIHAEASYFNEQGRSHSLLNASGTVVYMEGAGLFASRPIDQSFAVAEVRGVPDAAAYLNNQEVARTNSKGVAFIPNLLPYYGNRIRIDDSNLPADLEIDDGEVIVAPPPHGGARVIFESRRLRLVRGRLDPRGLPLSAVQYGTLTLMVNGRAWESPIGAGGEFELDDVPEGQWPARAVGEAACVLTLNVARSAQPIRNVGSVQCIADPGAAP
ncbi:MAG: fimbria/pilus outer membrane usher protein [Myxococcales bacterium]